MKTSHRQYRTKDLGEAAYLVSKGNAVVAMERGSHHALFVFEDREICERLAAEYWTGNGVVPAKKFSSSLRELKDLLFARSQ